MNSKANYKYFFLNQYQFSFRSENVKIRKLSRKSRVIGKRKEPHDDNEDSREQSEEVSDVNKL